MIFLLIQNNPIPCPDYTIYVSKWNLDNTMCVEPHTTRIISNTQVYRMSQSLRWFKSSIPIEEIILKELLLLLYCTQKSLIDWLIIYPHRLLYSCQERPDLDGEIPETARQPLPLVAAVIVTYFLLVLYCRGRGLKSRFSTIGVPWIRFLPVRLVEVYDS